jgi:hypothetical protein
LLVFFVLSGFKYSLLSIIYLLYTKSKIRMSKIETQG